MPDSKWRSLSFSDDPAAAFRDAQDLANDGKLVVVTWKNPHPTGTDSGQLSIAFTYQDETPEPGTIAMVTTGFIGLLVLARRRVV